VEWGYTTSFTGLFTKDIKNSNLRSGSSSSMTLSTRWSSNEGYTIGYTHTSQ